MYAHESTDSCISDDVDGSRFNCGCNYIENEPEVETVRTLLPLKESLYTDELRRSVAIDVWLSTFSRSLLLSFAISVGLKTPCGDWMTCGL